MIAMTMLPDILARVVGGSSWLGWFRMRLNLRLRCFAVREEAFDGYSDRNPAEARKLCDGCCCWWFIERCYGS
jgi:hypothetical protein